MAADFLLRAGLTLPLTSYRTMKNLTTAVSILGLLYGAVAYAAEKPAVASTDSPLSLETMTDEEKVNYNLGYDVGRGLKREKLRILPEVLLRGAEDGASGKKELVSTRQRAAAIKQIRKIQAKENLAKSLAFLAANGKEEGVKTLPSGLQYKVILAGEGKTPGPDDRVEVNYRGSLIDGTEFDSSYKKNKTSSYIVKKVIKGWQEALLLMQEGAKWELFIPPDLAYGKRGRKKVIPPQSALIFEVELVSVKQN